MSERTYLVMNDLEIIQHMLNHASIKFRVEPDVIDPDLTIIDIAHDGIKQAFTQWKFDENGALCAVTAGW